MVPDFVLAISKSLSFSALSGDGRTRSRVSKNVRQYLRVVGWIFQRFLGLLWSPAISRQSGQSSRFFVDLIFGLRP